MTKHLIIDRNLLAIILLAFFLLCARPSLGQQTAITSNTDIHQQLLNDPGNLDLLYAYAQQSIKEGNFEAAIGALEGMLVIAHNQPRVLLELGTLYQRLGSETTAQNYLSRAKALSGDNKKVSNITDDYLAETNKKKETNVLTGTVLIGLRHQSNPTLAPEAAEILSGGFNVPLSEARKPDADSNGLLFSRIEQQYQLTQHTFLASELIAYATAYNQNTQLNYGLLDFTSGPLFASPKNAGGQYKLRPHLILRGSTLDNSQFEQTLGAGVDGEAILSAMTTIKARYQFRDIDFKDYNDTGSAPLRSGNEHRLDLRYRYEYMRGHLVELGLFGRSSDAERQYLEVNQYDVAFRYSLKWDNFLLRDQQKMTLTPFIIRRFTDYGGSNPHIHPGDTRSDREWRLGLTYTLPVYKSLSAQFNMEHADVDSNIINYDVKNDLFMMGLQMGF